jgi:hypothetical protein
MRAASALDSNNFASVQIIVAAGRMFELPEARFYQTNGINRYRTFSV